MHRQIGTALIALAFTLGCGGGGATTGKDSGPVDPGVDLSAPDLGDAYEVLEGVFPDHGADAARDAAPDPAGDPGTTEEVVLECPGNTGCACKDNSECNSGFCIETMTGWECTAICQTAEACPKGWSCAVVATYPDITYACIDPTTSRNFARGLPATLCGRSLNFATSDTRSLGGIPSIAAAPSASG